MSNMGTSSASTTWQGDDSQNECPICCANRVTHVHARCAAMICGNCASTILDSCPFCRSELKDDKEWLVMQRTGEDAWDISSIQKLMKIGENIPEGIPQIDQWGGMEFGIAQDTTRSVDIHVVDWNSAFWVTSDFFEHD